MKHENTATSERIKYALRYSQVNKLSALALELGVDESAISRWRKNGNISIQNAGNLCSVLDVSMDWIILGRGEIQQHKKFNVSDNERELITKLRQLHPDSLVYIASFLKSLIDDQQPCGLR